MTKSGLEAIHLLSKQNIPTMATAVYHTHQALLAALAGADYAAPYLGRIEKAGMNSMSTLQTIVHLTTMYRLKMKILAAALQNRRRDEMCGSGYLGVTLKDGLFEKLIVDDPLTLKAIEQFVTDWRTVKAPFKL